MPDTPKQRLFTDQEISAVLKRAAELQQTQGQSTAHGLTRSEIEHAAQEVGIDPRWVEVAVRELDQDRLTQEEQRWHIWGAPMRFERERWVEGELSTDDWSDVVAEIRRTTNKAGDLEQIGSHLEWRNDGKDGSFPAHLVATPRKGQTRLTLNANFSNVGLYLLLLMVPLFAMLGIAGGMDAALWVRWLIVLGVWAASLLGTRFAIQQTLRSQHTKYDRLFDSVAATVEHLTENEREAEPTATATEPTTASPERMSLLDETAPGEAASEPRRAREHMSR